MRNHFANKSRIICVFLSYKPGAPCTSPRTVAARLLVSTRAYRTGAPCEESGARCSAEAASGRYLRPALGHLVSSFARSCCSLWRRPHTGFCRRGKPPYPRSVRPGFRTTTERPPETMHCSITWRISSGSFFCFRRPHRQSRSGHAINHPSAPAPILSDHSP